MAGRMVQARHLLVHNQRTLRNGAFMAQHGNRQPDEPAGQATQ